MGGSYPYDFLKWMYLGVTTYTMLFALVLCCVMLVSLDAAAVTCNGRKSLSSSLSSHSSVSTALNDQQFVNFQLRCLRGNVCGACKCKKCPCNTTGRKIKACLPDYLADGCSTQCTAEQQSEYSEIVDYMQQNHAQDWAEVVQIYGPDADDK